MKHAFKQLGVTLLEIMLVLAIAAFIVVMSIRYYQSAQASTGVNAVEGAITAVMANADNVGLAAGSYSGLASNFTGNLPGGRITTPWGILDETVISYTAKSSTEYTAKIELPFTTGVCAQLESFAKSVGKGHVDTTSCDSSGMSWTYKLVP